MNISKYYKMEPGDPTSVRLERFPSNATSLKTDADGNILDSGDDAYKVKVNADDATAGFLSDKLADTLDIEFNPTADNSKLESTIFQLTGKGAALASRDIVGLSHPEGPGITGFKYGRSCTPGYAYKLNQATNTKIKVHIWIAQSSNGTLFRSYDNFKSAAQDLSLVNYDNAHGTKISSSPYGAQCLSYITLSSGVNAWVNFIGQQEGYYILEDIPANYNDDGSIVQNNWAWVSVTGIPQWIGHAVRVTSGGIFATSSFTAGIYYTPDLVTWTKVESRSGSNEVAGISSDGYGTYLAVERNTGILIRNNSEVTGTFDPTAWNDITSTDGLTVTTPDGVTSSVNNLPVTTGYPGTWWAGLGCAYGLWVCTVALKAATTDPVYAYSDNGINWITYGGTAADQLITLWDMNSDGAFWFGCPVGHSTPLVYQLLVNSIPARKRFVAEKGAMIVGDFFLQDLPSKKSLATDENGKVIEGDSISASDLGEPDYADYVLGKPTGTFKWIPRDGLTGVVESALPELIVDGVAGTVTIPALTIQAYSGSEFFGNPQRYLTTSTTLSIPDGGNAYYIAFKDDMGPTIYLTSDKSTLNLSNIIPLYIVSRIGTSIHNIGFDTQGVGLPQKAEKALLNTTPYRRSTDGGLMLSEDGSRHISLTAATVFAGTTPFNVLAYDSNISANKLTHAYHVAGVWTYSTISAGNGQYDNSNYDNGTALVALGTNKYKLIWIFRSIGDDKEVFYVDSTTEYNTLDAAQLAQVPTIPPVMQWHCLLVGRIIVQNGASSGIVQSAFDKVFTASTVSDHNSLSGLQGGIASQYYHMTSAEYSKLQQLQLIYDAVVSTSADLQAALESATVSSIYVRLTSSGINIVLGSGTADQTIKLGTSKNLYGQPFTVGSSTSYVTTLALGSYNLRCRNVHVAVGGKLTFTGTGTAYIKKLSASGSSNLVVGVSGKLLVENLRTPSAVSNATINMWDMPLRSGSAVAIANNQYLKYTASTGEWTPVTITGPTDSPLLKAVDTMPVAAASGGVSIVRNSASTYRGHFTQMATNGDIKLDTNSKVQFFCTQAPGATPNYMIAIYESTSDTSVALTLVAYTTLAAFPNAIQWNSATLANIVSGITGLSASKRYFIGIIWASNNDANLLGVAGSGYAGATPKTLCPAFDIDNITITGGAPPSTFSSVGSEQTQRHHFRIYNQ